MRVLVYGAGVLGSLLAARLSQAGQEVRVLARGARLIDLRQHGIRLENAFTHKRENVNVEVVERLDPGDVYDLVAVVMGRHQTTSTLPSLSGNPHIPHVLFIGNNAAGWDEYTDRLGSGRVLLGFLSNGGTIREGVVVHGDDPGKRKTRMVLGGQESEPARGLEPIVSLCEAAGFACQIRADMDAWLKTHAALILPMEGALCMAGGETLKLASNREALLWMARGWKEALRVLDAARVPVTPRAARIYALLPAPLAAMVAARLLRTEYVQLALSHSDHVRPEMCLLVKQFCRLMQGAAPALAPALAKLFAAI